MTTNIANSLSIEPARSGRWLRFDGDLNFATVDEARRLIARALAEAKADVVLDLRHVGLLTSMGIELLIEASRLDGATSCVILPNGRVEEVLRIAKLESRFRIAHSEDEALRMAGIDGD